MAPRGRGRPPGSKNKATVQRQAKMAKAIEAGQTPLEYMLAVMRDPTADYDRRDEMAKAAAAYCHPRLSTISGPGKDGEHKIEYPDHRSHIESAFAGILTRDGGDAEVGRGPKSGGIH